MNFRVSDIEIKVNFWFAFVVCYLLCVCNSLLVRMAVLFSLLHECGHLFFLLVFDAKPQKILFGLCGMTIVGRDELTLNYKQECLAAFAGPFVNLCCFFIFYLLYERNKEMFFFQSASINLFIFLFNSLPIFSLDGGRILHAVCMEYLSEELTLNIEKVCSFFCILVVMTLGFYILLKSRYNFSLLLLSFYLIASLYKKSDG